MKSLSKDDHIRVILEFYKAGYITVLEKDKLLLLILINYNNKALEISTNVDGRELHYAYWMGWTSMSVKDDFVISYNVKSHTFFEGEL